MSSLALPIWLIAAFVVLPFLGAIMATLNWSGEKNKLTWSDEHFDWSVVIIAIMTAMVGLSPLTGDWFDVWNHLWLLTCGTFTGPLVFVVWLKALPTLNRLYSPSEEQVPDDAYPLDQRLAIIEQELATPQLEVYQREANS